MPRHFLDAKVDLVCEWCKKPFTRLRHRIRAKRSFCSQVCVGLASRGPATRQQQNSRNWLIKRKQERLLFKKFKAYIRKKTSPLLAPLRLRAKQLARLKWRCKQAGFTVQRYIQLCEEQNGCCAICQKPTARLIPDHDHLTGNSRGLLCHHCNVSLGLMHENIAALLAAIDYLHKYREQKTVVRG